MPLIKLIGVALLWLAVLMGGKSFAQRASECDDRECVATNQADKTDTLKYCKVSAEDHRLSPALCTPRGEVISNPAGTPGALLEAVIHSQESGDFEGAWRAWMAFFAHPDKNEVDLDTFSACFFLGGCGRPGDLGAILGKGRAEASALSSFCPQWQGIMDHYQDDEKKAWAKGHLEFIRSRAFDDSCEDWHQRQLAKLHEQPITSPAPPAQVVPLGFQEYREDGVWPTVQLGFGDRAPRVIVDTGSTTTTAMGNSPLHAWLAKRPRLTTQFIRWGTGDVLNHDIFRAPSLRLGDHKLEQVLVDVPLKRVVPEVEHILGMNVLLRYSSVCFHWPKAELHLGSIGPCAGGEALARVRLTASQVLMLNLAMEDGSTLDVLLDTGTTGSTCSQTFIDRNKGEKRYRFGPHPNMAATCREPKPIGPGETPLAPIPGQAQAHIGMEKMLEFDAFGWELNPLKVYFVPKTSGGETAADASPAKESQTAEAHARQS